MASGDRKNAGRFPQKPLGVVGWYSDFVVEIAGKTGRLWLPELNLALVYTGENGFNSLWVSWADGTGCVVSEIGGPGCEIG